MMWAVRFVVCFVAISAYSQLCDATRLEEFLQEKRAYLEQFDMLFDALYFNATSRTTHGESEDADSQRQVLRSPPLPSPDWSTRSIPFDDVHEEEDDEGDNDYPLDPHDLARLYEEESHRRYEQEIGYFALMGDVAEDSSGEGNVFSGDSGLSSTETSGDDEEEEYEDVGSGDSSKQTTTMQQTTLTVRESTTSVPVEENNAFHLECKNRLRVEIKSCIEFSWNVRTILQEMETLVAQSGYYNVSSSQYFYQLFRTCASTIASPSSCLHVATTEVTMDVIHNIATRATIAFSSRHKDDAHVDQRYLDCFQTHLQFLRSCLDARVTSSRLETLTRVVVVRAHDASLQECRDLGEVQQCVVGSTTRCQDPISVRLVDEMFQAARTVMTTCHHTRSAAGASGSAVTLLLAALILGLLHKQIN